MPRLPPQSRRHSKRDRSRALLWTTTVLALMAPAVADAQSLGLRGEVNEAAVVQGQVKKPSAPLGLVDRGATTAASEAGSQPYGYTPASTGAVSDIADEASATGTMPSAAHDSAFSDDPAPLVKTRRKKLRQSDEASEEGVATPGKKPAKSRTAKAATANADPAGSEDQEDWMQPANQRQKSANADETQPLDKGAERTGSIEGLNRKHEEQPFAAVGIRAGSFILRPSIEEGVTATSNADSSYNGASAVLSETTLRLNAQSDWRENSASADGYLTYRKTLSGQRIEDVRGRIDTRLDVDLADDLRAIARLGYEAAPESAASPVVIEDTVSQPLRQTFNGSLGVEKDAGKARFGLTGAVEHTMYGDAELSSGGTLSQRDRDSTLYLATLRGGYEISPALTPFVELEAGRRLYDQRVDNSGYERSAKRLGARAGVEVNMGEKLAGEFSAGWLREAIDDDRLAAVSGAAVKADLRWSPERGTTVGFTGSTIVEGTTTPGESGSVLYSSRLSLERQIRDNLTGTAALGADWRDYIGSDGRDLTLSAEASLTWWLNRYAGLTTRARTEKLTSNLPGREETTHSVFVGLKLQR